MVRLIGLKLIDLACVGTEKCEGHYLNVYHKLEIWCFLA